MFAFRENCFLNFDNYSTNIAEYQLLMELPGVILSRIMYN